MKRILMQEKLGSGQVTISETVDSTTKMEDVFQNEFGDENKDSSNVFEAQDPTEPTVLSKAKLYEYKPRKFATDYLVSGFNNSVLVNRYQPYQGGSGPINLTSSTALNGLIRLGTS